MAENTPQSSEPTSTTSTAGASKTSSPTPAPDSGPSFLDKAVDFAKKGAALASKAKEGLSKLAQAPADQFAENQRKKKKQEEEEQAEKSDDPMMQLFNQLYGTVSKINSALYDPIRNIAGNLAQKGADAAVDKIKSAFSKSGNEPANQQPSPSSEQSSTASQSRSNENNPPIVEKVSIEQSDSVSVKPNDEVSPKVTEAISDKPTDEVSVNPSGDVPTSEQEQSADVSAENESVSAMTPFPDSPSPKGEEPLKLADTSAYDQKSQESSKANKTQPDMEPTEDLGNAMNI
ncbi:hypothetical protein Lmor_1717 [Legionella moravica]|uniref:Uncharacterized protein n=1 Tax=Legionella moravica TaxID=39962 RepID=A0A378K131_9GAMM|nr:hypothetical protein [Legionella moravica]KTD34320.1 hypothetical protein Lmor_1717 [Legionella moravica]STX64037.1 Uncharacterised protein [Legionella moravica]